MLCTAAIATLSAAGSAVEPPKFWGCSVVQLTGGASYMQGERDGLYRRQRSAPVEGRAIYRQEPRPGTEATFTPNFLHFRRHGSLGYWEVGPSLKKADAALVAKDDAYLPERIRGAKGPRPWYALDPAGFLKGKVRATGRSSGTVGRRCPRRGVVAYCAF